MYGCRVLLPVKVGDVGRQDGEDAAVVGDGEGRAGDEDPEGEGAGDAPAAALGGVDEEWDARDDGDPESEDANLLLPRLPLAAVLLFPRQRAGQHHQTLPKLRGKKGTACSDNPCRPPAGRKLQLHEF